MGASLFLLSAALMVTIAQNPIDWVQSKRSTQQQRPKPLSHFPEKPTLIWPREEDDTTRDSQTKLLCDYLKDELRSENMNDHVSRIDVRVHRSAKQHPFDARKALTTCLGVSQTAKIRLEADVFTSSFPGETADGQLQLQLSLLDKTTKNKIFETTFRVEISDVRLDRRANLPEDKK